MSRPESAIDADPGPLGSSAVTHVDDSLFELSLEPEVVQAAPGESETGKISESGPSGTTEAYRLSWRVRAQRVFNDLVHRIYRSRVLQAVWAAIAIASIALLLYSLNGRLDRLDNRTRLLQELGELDSRALSIQSDWSLDKMQALEASVAQADTRRVFADYRSLAQWLQEQARYAQRLGLMYSYSLGESQRSEVDDMLEVPVALTLRGARDTVQLYLRSLEFLQGTISTPFYVEITRAALEGQGQGATTLQATLKVWVHSTVRASSADAE